MKDAKAALKTSDAKKGAKAPKNVQTAAKGAAKNFKR